MLGLTPRQADALAFIGSYTRSHGHSPSFREIANGIGLVSTNGVHRLVYALAERGHLTVEPSRARSIALTPAALEAARVS